jgi:hypothetical protein
VKNLVARNGCIHKMFALRFASSALGRRWLGVDISGPTKKSSAAFRDELEHQLFGAVRHGFAPHMMQQC